MKIYTDGGSRGNPGKAACSFVALKDGGMREKSKFIGIATNNEAEYNAIIMALEENKENDIEIISDSQLVINQIKGEYKINKPHLKKLYDKVIELIAGRNIKFFHLMREDSFITRADELVNQELDRN